MTDTMRDGATLLLLYFDKHGLNRNSFAPKAAVSRATIIRAVNRTRTVDIYSAAKIEKATKGFVPAASWALVKLKSKPKRFRKAA